MFAYSEMINIVPVTDVNKTKIRKYPCGYPGCQWVFTRTNHVVRHHERVHPGFKPVKNTSNDTEKGSSEPRKKPSALLVCTHAGCKHIFNDHMLLKNHTLLFHGNDNVLTSLTKQSAHDSSHLETSNGFKLREALIGQHLCNFNGCGQRFTSKSELNFHLFQVHSLVEPEVCIKVEGQEWNDDENNFLDKFKPSYPLELLTNDRNFTGSREDSSLVGSSLSQPIKFAGSPRPYACSLPGCDKTYTKNSHLVRHLVETHKQAKPSPKSNRRIGPTLSSPTRSDISSNLSSSTRVNIDNSAYNERPYACNFPGCGWSFKRQYHLNRHIITHRMFVADQLNRRQNNNNPWTELDNDDETLDNIVNLSTNLIEDEPYTCDFPGCGKVFIDSQKFVTHYLQHSGPSKSCSWQIGNETADHPPVECVLQELSDESDDPSSSNHASSGYSSDTFSKKVIIELDDS